MSSQGSGKGNVGPHRRRSNSSASQIQHGFAQARRASAGNAFEQPANIALPVQHPFPTLPAQLPAPGQSRQSEQQMQSILTMPPVLLAQLARTGNAWEQKELVHRMRADAYLDAMSLPPPSPAEESWAAANPQLTHNGIPILLQQVFSPETSGLTIMAPDQAPKVQFYASAEQWADSRAQEQGIDPADLEAASAQFKQWALQKIDKEVHSTIYERKHQAVDFAVQAAVQQQAMAQAATSPSTASGYLRTAPNLDAYAEHYKIELHALASGYYTKLHREALSTLLSNAPTSEVTEQPVAFIRASAVAALTANVMAATQMANSAAETLSSMGLDVSAVASPAPVHPAYSGSLQPPLAPKPTLGSLAEQPAPLPIVDGQVAPAAASVAAVIHQTAVDNRCTIETRDWLLTWAHTLYSRDPDNHELLPVLNMLNRLHSRHSPTMLLLSCVYYSQGVKKANLDDLQASIYWNSEILKVDADYVEAMSNIGTTLRALGKPEEAERWWWQALERRPTYFDAFDNLLGVLCNPSSNRSVDGVAARPRFEHAVKLCEFVESAIYQVGEQLPLISRPLDVPDAVPLSHIHRLQNLYYAKGNLYLARGDALRAKEEYEKGIEPLLAVPDGRGRTVGRFTLKDLLITATLVGRELMHHASGGHLPSAAQEFGLHSSDWLSLAHEYSDTLSQRLLQRGQGFFPAVLLGPTAVEKFAPAVFQAFEQRLPAFFRSPDKADSANQTTSTILLTLAKLFQDASASPSSPLARELARQGMPASPSLILPLYYCSISLHPSPSTYNNLGILVSSMPSVTTVLDPVSGKLVQLTGQGLAMQYYQAGLQKDDKHPHLYTNLGSLLKDTGRLQEAVQMYHKAVECNPNFDVALANLGNALKDMGHVQNSVQWYKRAVEINPNFPEAVCGLVNALGGVCDWRGRGAITGETGVDEQGLVQPPAIGVSHDGWMIKIAAMVDKQLDDGAMYGKGCMASIGGIEQWLDIIAMALLGQPAQAADVAMLDKWKSRLSVFLGPQATTLLRPRTANEGGFVIRLIERLMRRTQRRWYVATYGRRVEGAGERVVPTKDDTYLYRRPQLPPTLPLPTVPTVLPFHTFTYPLGARATRLISHRNALRISHSTLSQPWLPVTVYPPPPPPQPRLKVGYVSSDFNNHPLAHLMQSVFGYHDRQRFEIFCYATTASDQSPYRLKIEGESEHFIDVSTESNQKVVERIVNDGIHVLCNLNGYTKGARNEIFAARPSPVTMQFMGFAGTMAAGWNDWMLADPIVSPPDTVAPEVWRTRINGGIQPSPTDFDADLDPEEEADNWVYTERFVHMPGTYFCTDHKQSFNDKPIVPASTAPTGAVSATTSVPSDIDSRWRQEEAKRWQMRKDLFPNVPQDSIIFCCMNQLYKIDPVVYRLWLDILKAVPNSVLWLLRFPAAGEAHLKRTAEQWAGAEVASRIIFTDVASKTVHIERGRVADLFLDATECSAHTTCADILWAGTPVVTWPRHRSKFCSRVAASIVASTGMSDQMVASTGEQYQARAVALATSVSFTVERQADGSELRRGQGELYELRKKLFLSRDDQQLFDTVAWTRNVEKGYWEAWRRWVEGTEFEDSPEWQACVGPEKTSSSIYVDSTPAVPAVTAVP